MGHQMQRLSPCIYKLMSQNTSEYLKQPEAKTLRTRLITEPSSPKRYIRWTKEQNKDYALFLEKAKRAFLDFEGKRNNMIFIKMAEHLNNGRDNQQCRSHHIKMLRKLGSIEKIIKYFSRSKRQSKSRKKQQSFPDIKLPFEVNFNQEELESRPDLEFKEIWSLVKEENHQLFDQLSGPTFSYNAQ